MRRPLAVQLLILALALLPAALVPLVGAWALAVSALLLLPLLLPIGPAWGRRLVVLAAAVGGVVGVASAGAALLTVGAVEPYTARAPFGWAALALAMVAAAGGPVALRRPWTGAALMLAGGLAGAAAINLFFIDTLYVLAAPAWLLGAALAILTTPGRGHPPAR